MAKTPFVGSGYHVSPTPHVASFAPRGEPARLRGNQPLSLLVLHYYRVESDQGPSRNWRATTAGYAYSLRDGDGTEFLAYHWHPTGNSPITYPHLHIGTATTPLDLSRAHLPTGPVTLAAVVRLAIADLGVAPLRPDWRAVLATAELTVPPGDA